MVSIFEKHHGVDETDGTDKTIGPDTNHGGGSRTAATQDRRAEDQQLLAPIPSTLAPGDKSGDASECSRLLLLGDIHSPPR